MAKKTVKKTKSVKKKKSGKTKTAAKKTVRKAGAKRPVKKTKPAIRRKAAAKASKKRKITPKSPALKTKLKMEAIERALRAAVAGRSLKDTYPIEDMLTSVTNGQDEESLAEGTKFDIGVPHNAHAMVSQDIPIEYGKDKAAILVVDPRFVFSYWEIRHDSIIRTAEKLGHGAKLTLRFYDITSSNSIGECPSWDVEIFDRLGNWYLKLENPEQRLCLDVGMKGVSGEFIMLARSNIMRLPPLSLAAPGPIKWMVVTPAGDRLASEVEDYTEADLTLLKKILGPYFFDLLMRGRFASIAGSSVEAVFYDVNALRAGESPAGKLPWANL